MARHRPVLLIVTHVVAAWRSRMEQTHPSVVACVDSSRRVIIVVSTMVPSLNRSNLTAIRTQERIHVSHGLRLQSSRLFHEWHWGATPSKTVPRSIVMLAGTANFTSTYRSTGSARSTSSPRERIRRNRNQQVRVW
jgi:hypothetical protein